MNLNPAILIVRSLAFNVAFFGLTALWCIFLIWTLLLPNHHTMMGIIRLYIRIIYWLERKILRLDYEVRGLEHLPKDGAFILAAKHQSAWETMKIHTLIKDPVIILKEELKYLPLWGWYAAKAGFIFVKRERGGKSVASLLAGAKRAVAEGRSIVIFPQGTRVAPGAYKPYRIGAALLCRELGVPIVPMALNSGLYWSRRGFIKKPGKIIVEFLPPLQPGTSVQDTTKKLETELETATNRLVEEAKRNFDSEKSQCH